MGFLALISAFGVTNTSAMSSYFFGSSIYLAGFVSFLTGLAWYLGVLASLFIGYGVSILAFLNSSITTGFGYSTFITLTSTFAIFFACFSYAIRSFSALAAAAFYSSVSLAFAIYCFLSFCSSFFSCFAFSISACLASRIRYFSCLSSSSS